MLVTLKEILKIAEVKKCAIGAFNTPNLESLMAVIFAAEEENMPVIIMHAEIHEELVPLDIIGPIMVQMAEKSTVPVCVHLDHGTSLEYLQKALKLGFTSIMYDGSALSFDKNYENTCIAAQIAGKIGASVEAELGVVGRPETSLNKDEIKQDENVEDMYTDPDMAKKFAINTGIDALACSFGTAHGIYTKTPKLDFERVKKIHSMLSIPLVMHGGSGISREGFKKAIECGIRKVNYYTYMSKAGGTAVKEKINSKDIPFYHDIVDWGTKAMKEDVKNAIYIFSGK